MSPILAALLVATGTALVAAHLLDRLGPRRHLGPSSPTASTRSPWRRLVTRWRRDRPPDDIEVAAWCEQVAAAVRSGSSLTVAITEADGAVPRPVVPAAGQAVRRGRALVDALDELPGDPSTPSGLATAVLTSCARLGGPAAPALERVATTLRGRAAERAERRSASAQARLSTRVLTIVPFAVLALLAAVEAPVRNALVGPLGLACVGIGGLLNLVGWWWMRRLVLGGPP